MKRTFENLILEPANAAHITAQKKEKRKKGKKVKHSRRNAHRFAAKV